jgi:hypothetical protein
MRSLYLTPGLLACCVASLVSGAAAQDVPHPGNDGTGRQASRPERTGFLETSRYEDVMGFLAGLEGSPQIHLTSFGYTSEGRALPLAVVGRAVGPSPEEVVEAGTTRVLVMANIHAGEVAGKEATLMLLRSLADGRHGRWLDSLTLLVAPIYNADGNERISLSNRPRQHGPLAGMGQRPNAQGLDLNRDHMKVDSPEARSLLRLIDQYDPHVVVDLHTTNGTFHAYHLTYAAPMNPNTDQGIVQLLRNEWLPFVTRGVREKYGWEFYYYGNAPRSRPDGSGPPRGWYTYDHRPRFNTNYVGLRNRFAILGEAYSYATFQDRIAASLRLVEEVLGFAHANASRIREATERADAASVVGTSFAQRAQHRRSEAQVEILMGEVTRETNPYSGQTVFRRQDVRNPEMMFEFGTFEPIESVIAPQAYLVPASLTAVLQKLDAHGIEWLPIESAREKEVQEFAVDSTRVAEREYQGHRERTLWGSYESALRTVDSDWVRVPVDQPLGRVAVYFLEPRSDDGLVAWNLLGSSLDDADRYPILRVPAANRP